MALESQGVYLFWSTTTSGSTSHRITDVISFNGPGGAAAVIDVTNLQSTAKEKIMGLRDEGQVTLEALLDMTSGTTGDGQLKLRECRASRTRGNLKIKLTDASSSTLGMEAYCSNFSISGAVDQALKASITLEICGPVTWTTE